MIWLEAGCGLILLHEAAVLRLDHAYPRGHSLGQLRAVSDDAYHPSLVGGAVPLQVEPVERVGDGLERFLVQRAEPFVAEEAVEPRRARRWAPLRQALGPRQGQRERGE